MNYTKKELIERGRDPHNFTCELHTINPDQTDTMYLCPDCIYIEEEGCGCGDDMECDHCKSLSEGV